ncbi:MAG: cryptochrome/photolyase family protein [Bryobacteraceae bacterium]
MPVRDLLVILGDQLDRQSPLFAGADPYQDCIWMAEVREESTHVQSHQVRIAVFLSAMRHFRDELRAGGWTVDYREIDAQPATLPGELRRALRKLKPQRVRVVEPGDYRVVQALRQVCPAIDIVTDTHFLSTVQDFRRHAQGRKQLRMEFFYREMRRRYGVLMAGTQPEGGEWNYDSENRGAFSKQGPGVLPAPAAFLPDTLTQQVIEQVREIFAQHPGQLHHFDWPVTPEQTEQALQDFLDNRLPDFGKYQDAMWTAQPYLYHSRLSLALNLKLIHPRRVIAAAEERYRAGQASLAAVEGFIRQLLGWREYVRGIYWLHMPGYAAMNALDAHHPLPRFYWTGDTDMLCLRAAIRQTIEYGYAHHIQRLMVTGLFALLWGVEPKQVHEWYLAMYVDAVEWVELPNTIGMSQFADGGIMASKPYAATGKYIQRMSNYCTGCRYDPAVSTGGKACPFTTLYWDFLLRHEARLGANPRMLMQVRNLARLHPEQKTGIQLQAEELRKRL